MHSDLMRAASVDLHVQQRELSIARVDGSQDPVVSHRLTPPIGPCRHARSTHRDTADPTPYRAVLLLGKSVHQRNVFLPCLSCGKLRGQLTMRLIILCNHQQSAGLFIEPMDNARPQFPAYARQASETM